MSATAKGTILVVDDDRLVLATLVHGLAQAGYQVIDADNGNDAILLAREHRPDLALLDIRMEGKTGFDVAAYLRDASRVPFMFLSAFSDADTVAHLQAWVGRTDTLTDELNELLARQERLVQRARAQAGDLAHGLKTSLQLLLLEADQLNDPVQGQRIRAPVLRMQTLIEHQLARARAQSRAQVRGPGVVVADSVAALVRVLGPLASEHGVHIETVLPSDSCFAGDAADLDEMLGNLLDNACKWGRTQVLVAVRTLDDQLEITVEDDGPGLTDAQVEALFRRGARFDEQFSFHFYDMDFCRQCEQKGLRMGTWPISVIHQSGGSFGSLAWQAARVRYLQKWTS